MTTAWLVGAVVLVCGCAGHTAHSDELAATKGAPTASFRPGAGAVSATEAESATTAAAPSAPSVAPVAAASPPALDTTVGTFFVRALLIDQLEEAYACSPTTINDAAVVPGTSDESWFVGTCGLRLRHRKGAFSGTVESGTCGPVSVDHVAARSGSEVFVHSRELMVLAPMGVCAERGFRRPLEVFAGRRWRQVGGPVASGPFAASTAALWLLPDPVSEEPAFRVERFTNQAWKEVETPPTPVGFHGVGAYDGGVWVIGGYSDRQHHLVVAHFDGTTWVERVIDNDRRPERIALSVASDGTAWVAENAVWKVTTQSLTKLDLPALGDVELRGIALAKSSDEVWLKLARGGERMVVRFASGEYTQIDVREPVGPARGRDAEVSVVGVGANMWMFAADTIWQLVPPGGEPPAQLSLRATKMGPLQVEPAAAEL